MYEKAPEKVGKTLYKRLKKTHLSQRVNCITKIALLLDTLSTGASVINTSCLHLLQSIQESSKLFLCKLETESVILRCCCSVPQSCGTLFHPRDCSTPGLPAHRQLPELAQTHVHWVGDAIPPSHPLLSPSPPALNLSQQQGLPQRRYSTQQFTYRSPLTF